VPSEADNPSMSQSKNRPTEIGIDFDGVAWSLVNSLGLLPDCPLWKGEVLTHDNCDDWETVIEIWGPGTDVEFAFTKMDEARALERLRRFGLFPRFAEAIATFRANGITPTIISHNSEEALAGIRTYLDELGLELEIVRARPADKIAWCQERNAPLVDDAPETIRLAAESGVALTAPRYPYNAKAIDETGTVWASMRNGWSELLPLTLMNLGVKNPSR
jgi:hypothetical protein